MWQCVSTMMRFLDVTVCQYNGAVPGCDSVSV